MNKANNRVHKCSKNKAESKCWNMNQNDYNDWKSTTKHSSAEIRQHCY